MMNRQVNDGWMTALIEASSDAIISYTPDGEILTWNRGAEVMFGYSAREVIGQSLSLLAPSDLQAEQEQILQTIQNGESVIQLETVRVRNGGERFPVNKTISPVQNASGVVTGAIAIIQDVTERKRMEANLAFLAEVSQDLTHLTSIDETMNALGAKIGAYLGLSACIFGEIFGHDEAQITEITHGWNRADSPSLLGTYHMREFMTIEMIHMCRSSETIIIRDVFTDPKTDGAQYAAINIGSFVGVPLIRDGDWRFLLVVYRSEPHDWNEDEIALVRELTTRVWTRLERARAEEALRASEEQYRLLFDSIDEGFCVLEYVATDPPDFRYIAANPAFARHTGVVGVVGKTIREAFPGAPQAALDVYQQVMMTSEPMRFEMDVANLGRFMDVYAFRIDDTTMLATLFTDITARKRGEIERAHLLATTQQARTNAESALQVRDQFLSIASHELRTPLTSLLGYASMLQSGTVNNPSLASTMGERIIRQAQRLNSLVGQLLDISRLQRGQFMVVPQPLNMTTVVAQVVDAMRVLASTATHPLVFTHPDEPVMIMGDAERLEQVVQNLISNAIKYTPMGGAIHVLVRMIANDALVEVTDHGIGIPEAARVQLFQPFYRAANVGTQASGFGIGLYVAQEIIERHGGRIEVESVEGDGSTFRVLLPLLSI